MDTVTVIVDGASSGALTQLLDLIKFLGAIALAVLSAYLAYRFAGRQATRERQQAYITRQIAEFYSPMVGLRNRIRALSTLRAQVHAAADDAWKQTVDAAPAQNPAMSDYLNGQFVPFEKLLDYEDEQLRTDLLPAYEKMLGIFTDHYWLSEAGTRPHFDELLRFVEIWRRHLNKSLPDKVREQLSHSEARLHPLYVDLDATLARLVESLRK